MITRQARASRASPTANRHRVQIAPYVVAGTGEVINSSSGSSDLRPQRSAMAISGGPPTSQEISEYNTYTPRLPAPQRHGNEKHDCGHPQQDAQWTDPRFSLGVVQQNYLQNSRFEQAHSHQHYNCDQQQHNHDQSTDVNVLNQQVNVSVDQPAPLIVDQAWESGCCSLTDGFFTATSERSDRASSFSRANSTVTGPARGQSSSGRDKIT
jgi:hypothetical protein